MSSDERNSRSHQRLQTLPPTRLLRAKEVSGKEAQLPWGPLDPRYKVAGESQPPPAMMRGHFSISRETGSF